MLPVTMHLKDSRFGSNEASVGRTAQMVSLGRLPFRRIYGLDKCYVSRGNIIVR